MTRQPLQPDADSDVRAEAIRLYLKDGLTRSQVARTLHVTDHAITAWLAGHARPRGIRPRPDVENRALVLMRDRDQMSWQEIADALSMSRTGVRMRYLAATGQQRPGRQAAAG